MSNLVKLSKLKKKKILISLLISSFQITMLGLNGLEVLARLMEEEVLKPEIWQGSWLPCVPAFLH